jgi:hypothetical protein
VEEADAQIGQLGQRGHDLVCYQVEAAFTRV